MKETVFTILTFNEKISFYCFREKQLSKIKWSLNEECDCPIRWISFEKNCPKITLKHEICKKTNFGGKEAIENWLWEDSQVCKYT